MTLDIFRQRYDKYLLPFAIPVLHTSHFIQKSNELCLLYEQAMYCTVFFVFVLYLLPSIDLTLVTCQFD